MTVTLQPAAFEEHNISPELALVDPDLATEARMLLPNPSELERTRRTSPAVGGVSRSRPVSSPKQKADEPSRWTFTGRSRLAAVAATGLAALVAGTFGFVLAADPATADTTGGSADASRAALQAQAARQAREARTYTWSAPSAVAYQFKILRGEDTVFETTTTDLAVELRLRLAPGRYTWSVTPTFENQSAVLLRRPVVEATFEVATT